MPNLIIEISQENLDAIFAHGEQTYPEECCGVLIGQSKHIPKVLEIREMRNTNEGSRSTRYNIDPLDLLELEDELDAAGLTMLGIYHSHPDHPARPSVYDLNHAWPNLSYMVVSVDKGRAKEITSWRLDGLNKEFREERIQIRNSTNKVKT